MSLQPAAIPSVPERAGRSVARAVAWVVIVSGLLYGLTVGGSLTTTDARYVIDVTRSLVEERSVALSRELSDRESNRGIDGRHYSQYGLGHSIYGVPFFVAGRAVDRLVGDRVGRPRAFAKAAFSLGSAVAAAICVAFCFFFAWRLTADGRAALFAAAAAGVASPLWPYAGFGFNAALAAALLVSSSVAVWVGARDGRASAMLAGGVLLGFGWVTRHEQILAVLPVAVFLLLEHRSHPRRVLRDGLLLAPGLLGAAALLGAYNQVRFGSPVETGYSPTFGLEGFWGLTVSPGGSVFLYAPIVVVALAGLWALARRGDLASVALVGGEFLLFFVFFASLDDWPGGRSYGPRYLVPAIALVCVATAVAYRGAPSAWRRVMLAVLVLSTLVQLPGVLVDYSRVSRDVPLLEQHKHLATSALGATAAAAWQALPRNARYLAGLEPPPRIPRGGGDEFQARLAFSLDLWWAYMFYLGVLPRWLALAIPVIGGVALAYALARLRAAVGALPTVGRQK